MQGRLYTRICNMCTRVHELSVSNLLAVRISCTLHCPFRTLGLQHRISKERGCWSKEVLRGTVSCYAKRPLQVLTNGHSHRLYCMYDTKRVASRARGREVGLEVGLGLSKKRLSKKASNVCISYSTCTRTRIQKGFVKSP
jgi:hypothetical protein